MKGIPASSVVEIDTIPGVCHLSDLAEGKWIHSSITVTSYPLENILGNKLLSMSTKSNNFIDACQMFDEMPKRNAITWNAMVAGCFQNTLSERFPISFVILNLRAESQINSLSVKVGMEFMMHGICLTK